MERSLSIEYKSLIPSFSNAETHLDIVTYDGSGEAIHPDIIYSADGIFGYHYWMVNTPYPESNAYYENPSIWCSNDGIDWVVPDGLTNPIVSGPVAIEFFHSDPCIVYCPDDELLRVYYRYSIDLLGNDEIRMVSSSDGIVWTSPVTVISFTTDKHLSPQVAYDNEKQIFRLWMFRHTGGGGQFQNLVQFTSKDGVNFAKSFPCIFPATAIGINPWHFNIKYYRGKFIGCFSDTIHGHIYFFESNDYEGTSFSIVRDHILTWGETGAWDSGMLYQNVLLPVSNSFRLYYTGILGSNETIFLGIANNN